VFPMQGVCVDKRRFGGRVVVPENGPMKQLLIRLWKDEEAQDLTEYALLLVLLALAAVASLNSLATALQAAIASITAVLNDPT